MITTTVSRDNWLSKLIWISTVLLFVVFILFVMYPWGRYVFLGLTCIIGWAALTLRGGRLKLRFDAFQAFSLIFIVYTAYSATWALDPGDSIQMAVTLAQTLICASVLYWHYWGDNIDSLLSALKWAGYIIALYTIFFFGVDVIKEATQSGQRLENEFANVNGVATQVVLAILVLIYEVHYKKVRIRNLLLNLVLTIPAFYVIAATQSRKSLFGLLLGGMGLILLKDMEAKNIVKILGKGIIVIALASTSLYFLSNMPLFEGMVKRTESLINIVGSEGRVDTSTLMRQSMINLGWEYFKKQPIGGVGIGCPHILAAQQLRHDAYLHNNYIELLCGGGVLGFLAYYSIYVYLLFNLFKYKNVDSGCFAVGFVMILILLLMDYATVSFYNKFQVYFLAILCLNIEYLKRKNAMEKRNYGCDRNFYQSL